MWWSCRLYVFTLWTWDHVINLLPLHVFLRATSYPGFWGKQSCVFSSQKHSRQQPCSLWKLQPSRKGPFPSPSLSPGYRLYLHISAPVALLVWGCFPQFLVKSLAVAVTHISKLWVNALYLLSPSSVILLKSGKSLGVCILTRAEF